MKKLNVVFKLSSVAAMGALFMFSSCINKEYDLNNGIVADATLFENIAAPIGNVEKITLDKLLFSEDGSDSGISYNDSGDLYIDFAGGNTSVTVGVDEISIDGIDLEGQDIMFNIPDQVAGLPANLVDMTIKYSDVEEGGLAYSMDMVMDAPLPEGIESVSEAYLDATLNCKFNVSGGKMYVSKGFEFVFPEFLKVSSDDKSYEIVDGHVVRFTEDVVLSTDSPIVLALSLDRLIISDDAIVTDSKGNRMIKLDGSVKVNGDFYIQTKDYQVIPESLRIAIDVASGKIKVTEAMVSLDIDTEIPGDDIVIGDLPELFTGDDVCVDLYNPVISLAIDNSSPFDFSLDADITAYSGSEKHDVHLGSYGVENDAYVFVPASESVEYDFSRRPMSSVAGGVRNVVVPAMGELIKTVPERISIHDLNVNVVNGPVMVKTGSEFEVSLAYGMSSPLSFGEDLFLSFVQDIEDLNLELGVKIQSAELGMSIVNSIPADFDIKAVCLDASGNESSMVKVSVDKVIAAGSQASPATTPVVLRIENTDGTFNVSSLRLTLTATSVNPEYHGVCLNRNQGLEINDIVLRLPDGIGVELK